jgi:hypothetical protein
MANIIFSGSHRVIRRRAGAWSELLGSSTVPSMLHPGSTNSWDKIYQCYLRTGGAWQLYYTTNAHAPAAAPISPTLTITGTAFARHCKVDWTNPTPAGTYNAYNTYIRFTNNTDPTKTVTNSLTPNGGTTTFTISAAGQSGDSVTVDVWFNDGTFDGPTSTVSGTL